MQPGQPPGRIVANLTVKRALLDAAVKLNRVFFSTEVLMNVRRRILRAIGKCAVRVFVQYQLKIFQCLSVIVSVPENLSDLVKRLWRFGTRRVLACNLL